jgi:hypothetical protein
MPPRGETAAAMVMAGDRYELATVGGRRKWTRDEARAKCDERPFVAWYTLQGNQWKSVDSVFYCGEPPPRGTPVGRLDSGYFTMSRDTIEMRVPNTQIGVKGLIALGRLSGDTLLMWFTEEDGGDYLYLKPRKR